MWVMVVSERLLFQAVVKDCDHMRSMGYHPPLSLYSQVVVGGSVCRMPCSQNEASPAEASGEVASAVPSSCVRGRLREASIARRASAGEGTTKRSLEPGGNELSELDSKYRAVSRNKKSKSACTPRIVKQVILHHVLGLASLLAHFFARKTNGFASWRRVAPTLAAPDVRVSKVLVNASLHQ